MEITTEEIKNNFKVIFNQIAPEITFEKINLDLPLRDQVEIDSLDFYNVIVALQKKTGIYVSDSKLAELSSLNELINYILGENKKAGEQNGLKS